MKRTTSKPVRVTRCERHQGARVMNMEFDWAAFKAAQPDRAMPLPTGPTITPSVVFKSDEVTCTATVTPRGDGTYLVEIDKGDDTT